MNDIAGDMALEWQDVMSITLIQPKCSYQNNTNWGQCEDGKKRLKRGIESAVARMLEVDEKITCLGCCLYSLTQLYTREVSGKVAFEQEKLDGGKTEHAALDRSRETRQERPWTFRSRDYSDALLRLNIRLRFCSSHKCTR